MTLEERQALTNRRDMVVQYRDGLNKMIPYERNAERKDQLRVARRNLDWAIMSMTKELEEDDNGTPHTPHGF